MEFAAKEHLEIVKDHGARSGEKLRGEISDRPRPPARKMFEQFPLSSANFQNSV